MTCSAYQGELGHADPYIRCDNARCNESAVLDLVCYIMPADRYTATLVLCERPGNPFCAGRLAIIFMYGY